MYLPVLCQVRESGKRHVAEITFKWFFFNMDKLVALEETIRSKCFAAYITGKKPGSEFKMDLFMLNERSMLKKGLVTLIALVRTIA